jgi:hypothetical protein
MRNSRDSITKRILHCVLTYRRFLEERISITVVEASQNTIAMDMEEHLKRSRRVSTK